MKSHRIIKKWTASYDDPISVKKGDKVIVDKAKEIEPEWDNWQWTISNEKSGWVPIQIIEALEVIDENTYHAVIKEDYSARELDVEIDEIVEVYNILNGWIWCKKVSTSDIGWIPLDCVNMLMDKLTWNSNLQRLRSIISDDTRLDEAKCLILKLHAMVYPSEMSGINQGTFEDEVWENLNEDTARKAINKKGRTVLYGLWHSTRIEDITMNLLVAGKDQLFEKNNWFSRIGSPIRHAGNSLTCDEILKMSSTINIDELKAYRMAVGHNSEEIIRNLKSGRLKQKVYIENLQRILDEGVVDNVESANWLIDFWGKKNVAGIILMPCLRHQLVHINESLEVKHV